MRDSTRLQSKNSVAAGLTAACVVALVSGCSLINRFKGVTAGSEEVYPSSPRVLSFAETPSFDLGIVPLGSTRYFKLSVTSQGKGNATLVSASLSDPRFEFLGGSFPGDGGTCVQPISGNCSVGILFTAPTAIGDAGLHAATLSILYESGGVERSTSLTVSASTVPSASLWITGNADFGTLNVGDFSETTLTVLNAGALYATNLQANGLSAPFRFKGGAYPGTGGDCGSQLAPLASCSLVLVYEPTTAGPTAQNLQIDFQTQSSPASATRALQGTAVDLARLEFISPPQDPYDFGSVVIGSPGSVSAFILRNTGGQTATGLASAVLAAPFTFNGGSYPGTGGNCGTALSAGATCTLSVRFLPSSTGQHSATLRMDYDDGSGNTLFASHDLEGQGSSAALLVISDAPAFDFGVQTTGTTTTRTLTITNTGGSPATGITSATPGLPFRYRGNAYPGTGGNCGASLGAGATCTLSVEFIPTSTGGFQRSLSVNYNDGIASSQTQRQLVGTGGAVANLVISDGPTFDFGSIGVGYFAEQTLTITNVGSAAATSLGATALTAPLSFKGGSYPGSGGSCGNSLGALGVCTVVVRYTPTSATPLSSQLRLNYHNGASNTNSILPITGSGATIVKLAAGGEHSCALYSTGHLRCWGSNTAGQLGNGSIGGATYLPEPVPGITTAVDIAAGSAHTCALLANQRIQCWGSDSNGQLGNDTALISSPSPVFVATYSDFTQVAAGGNRTCGLRSNGSVACWGEDSEGGVGNGSSLTDTPTPASLAGGLNAVTSVSMGRGHACVTRSTGNVRCWGSDSEGQIGNGDGLNNVTSPTNVPGANGASSIFAGGNNTCSLHEGGETRCWGANVSGQLGDGNAPTRRSAPIVVTNLAQSTAIALGFRHGCAKDAANALACWGDDQYGQIGNDASFTLEPVPVPVYGLGGVTHFATGDFHSCAIENSGRVYCWGMNSSGQIGRPSPSSQALPVFVDGL